MASVAARGPLGRGDRLAHADGRLGAEVVPVRRRAFAAALGAAALLAACASPPKPAPEEGAMLEERLSGRLALRVDGDARRSFNAIFDLVGTAERGRLGLSTPLGQQVAEAEWSLHEVSLRSRQGERRYADLDSMAADALGERVPMAALFDWLRGRPWPGAASTAAPGGFEQLGWQVDVSQQREGTVQAHRLSQPVVTVQVRLDLP
jgi:outer membrane lipoprotein LolB